MRPRPNLFLRGEPLEKRQLLSATAFEHGDIAYLVHPTVARIERYDISAETWLSPLTLQSATGVPTVVHADSDGIYAAYGKSVYRYQLDGSSPTLLTEAQQNVQALHTDGALLFVNYSSSLYARLTSINKTNNAIIATFENYTDSLGGSSISTETNRIIGRTQGVSPSDVSYVSYTDAGAFVRGGDSPYHGDYPGATKTWMFPGGTKVVDDSGTIYATQNLTRLNAFGTTVTDVGFHGSNIPIVLSGRSLTAYTSGMQPAGNATLSYSPSKIFVNDHNVLTFTADASSATGYLARTVALESLSAPDSGGPVDPIGLPYSPEEVVLANDGTLLLFSPSHQSIFRWDPATQQYGETISLAGVPDHMAYSSTSNTIYLAYASGAIAKIELSAAALSETPFASLPSSPLGLATAGPFVFTVDDSGAWVTHYTFAPNGAQVDAVDWNYYSTEYVWSEANQKMYFFRDDTSPNDLLSEEINANGTAYPGEVAGGIGAKRDSPLHTSTGFQHPIRVSPDGSIVVLGSGAIHDGTTLARKTESLANTISDAAWLGDELYTIRTVTGIAQFQRWSPSSFGLEESLQVAGTALALKTVAPNRLVGISRSAGGIPIFTVLDGELGVIQLNEAASDVSLQNIVGALPEDINTAAAIKLADITIVDDGRGFNTLSLSGPDAAKFELFGKTLRLKAGAILNFESQPTLVVSVNADDPAIVAEPDATTLYTLNLTNVNEVPTGIVLSHLIGNLAEGTSTAGGITIADVSVLDDSLGANTLSLSGPDAASFELVGAALRLRAGTTLDYEVRSSYSVTINVDDSTIGNAPDASIVVLVNVTNVNEAPSGLNLLNAVTLLAENTSTSTALKLGTLVFSDDALGSNVLSLSGSDSVLFEIVGNELRLKAGAVLNFENKSVYGFVIRLDDASVGATPDSQIPFILTVADVNEAASDVHLQNVVPSLPEDSDTSAAIKLADIVVVDDALGSNALSLSGPDAALLQIVGTKLQLRAGVLLNSLTNSTIQAVVNVDDATIGGNPDAVASVSIAVTPDLANDPPLVALVDRLSTVAESADVGSAIEVGRIVVIDDNLGNNVLSLGGPDADSFEIVGNSLRLKPGIVLNFETKSFYDVVVSVDDPAIGSTPDAAVFFTLHVSDANEAPTQVTLHNQNAALAEDADTSSATKVADIAIVDDALGVNELTLSGPDAGSFEIVGMELRLRAGVALDFATKPLYSVSIDVDDASLGGTPDASIVFALSITESVNSLAVWCNFVQPEDVDADGAVDARDALLVINNLLVNGVHTLHGPRTSAWYWDVSDDMMVSARDALMVISHLLTATASERHEASPSTDSISAEHAAWAAAVDQALAHDAWGAAELPVPAGKRQRRL